MRQESPFWFHATRFDVEGTIVRHAAQPEADPRFLTNYLGVKIDPKFFPTILSNRIGEVEDVPIPANWHADLTEWAYALRAVERSAEKFTMIELGCGWGCWMNNTGVVAKRMGKDVKLIGIEGDEGHVGFALESLDANGFSPSEYEVIRGIAGPRPGTALFPKQDRAGMHWGLEPVFNATRRMVKEAKRSGTHEILPVYDLNRIMADHSVIDLLHIDIQGGEVDMVAGCIETLNRRCAAMLIGTHSRKLEGQLCEILFRHGWALDIERTAIITLTDGEPVVTVDGVQGWRNPRFTANP